MCSRPWPGALGGVATRRRICVVCRSRHGTNDERQTRAQARQCQCALRFRAVQPRSGRRAERQDGTLEMPVARLLQVKICFGCLFASSQIRPARKVRRVCGTVHQTGRFTSRGKSAPQQSNLFPFQAFPATLSRAPTRLIARRVPRPLLPSSRRAREDAPEEADGRGKVKKSSILCGPGAQFGETGRGVCRAALASG